MADLIVLVLDNPSKMDEVLNIWVAHSVPGVTMLDSAGLGRQIDDMLRDDLPLVPSLESLLRSREESHRTVFSVVPDGFDVDGLVKATEQVTGPCEESNTAFIFVVPVNRVWGLRPRHASKGD
jgi:nitrogen regulatory protein PII